MKNKPRTKPLVIMLIVFAVVIILILALSMEGKNERTPNEENRTQTAISSLLSPSVSNLFPSGIEGDFSPAQQDSYSKLASESVIEPSVRIDNGVVRFLLMELSVPDTYSADAGEKAKKFLQDYSELLDINDPENDFEIVQETKLEDYSIKVQFAQTINNIPVYGASLTIIVSPQDSITVVTGGYIPGKTPLITPLFNYSQAEEKVVSELLIDNTSILSPATLLYMNDVVFEDSTSETILVWKVNVVDDNNRTIKYVYVDAISNEIVLEIPMLFMYQVDVFNNQNNSYNNLSDAIHIMNTQGCLSGQSCDQDALDAHEFSMEFEEFVWKNYKPVGNDSPSEQINVYTHISIPMNLLCLQLGGGDNAFWDQERQAMSFTDGMSRANDIVFHELTHRLTAKNISTNNPDGDCNGLCYRGQSGALSESFSDVFGVLIDNGNLNSDWQTSNWIINDWQIGEDLGEIIRDISQIPPSYQNAKNPNCRNDYGYVHSNSLIPSKAAHLLMQYASSTYNSVTTRGIGPLKVSQIFYSATLKHINENSSFRDARDGILLTCYELIGKYGIVIDDCYQVANAFAAVGIGDPATPPQNFITITPGTISTIPWGGVSSTVLVFDTSGSMSEYDSSGMTKIDAAKRAGAQILNVIDAENTALGASSQVGVAQYSTTASMVSQLTSDISSLQAALASLVPTDYTGMADGLNTGLGIFGSTTDKKVLILLSDGLPNVALNSNNNSSSQAIQQEVIDLATQAGQNNTCIYTVGFGDPAGGGGSIDEGFLQNVANASGCGAYYNAQNSIDLANVYVELRHTSTGNILFKQAGLISQGQEVDLGVVAIPANQELALFTLNWPGSKLDLIIEDPSGKTVDANSPGVTFSVSPTIISVIMSNPKAGDWKLSIRGADVPEGTTNYNTIISTRTGTATTVPTSGGSFPLVILLLVLSGGGIGVYVYSNSIKRASHRGGGKTTLQAILKGRIGSLAGQSITLHDGFIVGRGSSSHLRLNDPAVSRLHARFRCSEGIWYIQDMESRSGILVNGAQVHATRLNQGDLIQIGTNSFTFSGEGK